MSKDSTLQDMPNGESRDKESDVEKAAADGDAAQSTDVNGATDKTVEDETNDPNIVGWDGPDDPEDPMHWSASKKWLNIAVLSVLTIIT